MREAKELKRGANGNWRSAVQRGEQEAFKQDGREKGMT